MKPKSLKLIEEIGVEVVNRQPNVQERCEISVFIRSPNHHVLMARNESRHGGLYTHGRLG